MDESQIRLAITQNVFHNVLEILRAKFRSIINRVNKINRIKSKTATHVILNSGFLLLHVVRFIIFLLSKVEAKRI